MIDIHRSEEETVEAIKKWWKENGAAVITGIVIGVALIVGVRYWWTYQERHAEESSQIYSQLLNARNLGNAEQLAAHAGTLKRDYDDTPYATFAAFMLAQSAINADETDKAVGEYQWAVKHAPHEALEHLARVRLARLLVDTGQYERALELIGKDGEHTAFSAQYNELRGDIYQARDDVEQARSAYQIALGSASGKHRRTIQMKLHSLVQANPAPADEGGSEPSS